DLRSRTHSRRATRHRPSRPPTKTRSSSIRQTTTSRHHSPYRGPRRNDQLARILVVAIAAAHAAFQNIRRSPNRVKRSLLFIVAVIWPNVAPRNVPFGLLK